MISDTRIRHMLGVARRCYEISKEQGFAENEDEAEIYWLMGLLHDIGYEFMEDGEEKINHTQKGAKILEYLRQHPFKFIHIVKSVRDHGDSEIDLSRVTTYTRVLNAADMSTNRNGQKCTFQDRLMDIQDQYGIGSKEYREAKNLITRQKLEELFSLIPTGKPVGLSNNP